MSGKLNILQITTHDSGRHFGCYGHPTVQTPAIDQFASETGLEHNTLVVFTTDHGIEMPRAKWHLYDPGIAIGMVMRAPSAGLTAGQKYKHLMSNVDYLPTILDLARIECPDVIQGRSFADSLCGRSSLPMRDAVFGLFNQTQTRFVRTNKYKLIHHFNNASDFHTVPVRMEDMQNKRVIKLVELFDLRADPNEFINLADQPEYTDTQKDLENRLWNWMESVDDPLLRGPVRTPSYDAAIGEYQRWREEKHD